MTGSPGIAAGLAEVDQERVARILVFPVADEPRQPVAEGGGERQGLAHLSRRAPAPVGDDVGRHGRAQAPVALVDVLDDPLAPVSARQVEVDVGPLAALLGEEALEEQLHPHRIDGRDPERIAHGAVGGRAPPLHQDVVAAAVLDQVPDDQEVARQVEAADELDLALDLFSRALAERPRAVARRRAFLAEGAEETDRRLARRQRVVGEAIAQVLEREAEPQRQLAAVGHGRRAVGEEPLHLAAGFKKSFAVAREQLARLRQRHAVADAGQRVQQRPIPALSHERGVAGEERQPQPLRFRPQPLVLRLLLAFERALELGVDAEAAEEAGEPVERRARGLVAVTGEPPGHGTFDASRETDESAGVLFEIIPAGQALALGRAHLDPRQQLAEVFVALAVLHEERQPAAVPHADLGADERRDPEARAGAVEARRSVDAVGVHEGEGGLAAQRKPTFSLDVPAPPAAPAGAPPAPPKKK